jgi:hypothetical protein
MLVATQQPDISKSGLGMQLQCDSHSVMEHMQLLVYEQAHCIALLQNPTKQQIECSKHI